MKCSVKPSREKPWDWSFTLRTGLWSIEHRTVNALVPKSWYPNFYSFHFMNHGMVREISMARLICLSKVLGNSWHLWCFITLVYELIHAPLNFPWAIQASRLGLPKAQLVEDGLWTGLWSVKTYTNHISICKLRSWQSNFKGFLHGWYLLIVQPYWVHKHLL